MRLGTTTDSETGQTIITYFHDGVAEVWTPQEAFELALNLFEMAFAINEETILIQALQEAEIHEKLIMSTINLWRKKRMEQDSEGWRMVKEEDEDNG